MTRGVAGRRSVTAVPRPCSLSMLRPPPCRWRRPSLTLRPRPVLFTPLVVKKGSRARCWTSGDMPAARARKRPCDLAIFLIQRYTGMRRDSVATLRVRNIDAEWGIRNVRVKGGKTRDIPLPAAVTQYLQAFIDQVLVKEARTITSDTPIFWSTWGQARRGKVRQPMTGKNLWRLCKTYGRLIGYPQLRPHDLRHGVAMEGYEQHGDLEQLRGLLGHARIDTTQVYAQIRPAHLRKAVGFYKGK